ARPAALPRPLSAPTRWGRPPPARPRAPRSPPPTPRLYRHAGGFARQREAAAIVLVAAPEESQSSQDARLHRPVHGSSGQVQCDLVVVAGPPQESPPLGGPRAPPPEARDPAGPPPGRPRGGGGRGGVARPRPR